MLGIIIGGVIVAFLITGSVWLCCHANSTVPPRDLRKRWHAETGSPRRR